MAELLTRCVVSTHGPMRDAVGRLWWTTGQACAQLGVDRKRINDWVRRGLVDPPVRHGRLSAYLAEQLLDAEWRTSSATRGRIRAA